MYWRCYWILLPDDAKEVSSFLQKAPSSCTSWYPCCMLYQLDKLAICNTNRLSQSADPFLSFAFMIFCSVSLILILCREQMEAEKSPGEVSSWRITLHQLCISWWSCSSFHSFGLEWSCCLCLRATRSNALLEDPIMVILAPSSMCIDHVYSLLAMCMSSAKNLEFVISLVKLESEKDFHCPRLGEPLHLWLLPTTKCLGWWLNLQTWSLFPMECLTPELWRWKVTLLISEYLP